ncbi:nitroreductase family protein [Marimonas arenosa]|uniref:Nitroreductase family protein n=1 Tax=Marimonas arenosa TaxID=1795305 RepID=A0AAE3WCF4_9RHOB|nr:nitroreductase family protein [Marimonas arenosa]MDQ2089068.1 nitroreductase family protein [Marimonas arenosa]
MGDEMATSSNPLKEMETLRVDVASETERPNASFLQSALPGFDKTVTARRAIRIFDGTPIPEDVMRDCLRHATLAPSSSNLECYELHWVRTDAKKKELSRLCMAQPAAETAGDLVVAVSRVDLWETHLRKLTDIMTHGGANPLKGPVRDYYENIVPMLMKTDPFGFNNFKRRIMFWLRRLKEPTVNGPVRKSDHRVYGHIQSALAAENLMLSLAAHGYESCPMGGIDKKAISDLLGLPSTAEVTMVIGAGTGKPEGLFSQRTRLPYEDLVKEV